MTRGRSRLPKSDFHSSEVAAGGPGTLLHKAVSESCCAVADVAARAARCDDVGMDAARLMDAMADFGTTLRNDPAGSPGFV